MKVDSKLAVTGFAAALIVLLIAASILLKGGSPVVDKSGASLDETFGSADFTYGPQASIPYAYAVPFVPGSDPAGDNRFRFMLVDLNLTSRSGGDPMGAGPAYVDYSFKGLQGAAAFHVFGYNRGSGRDVAWMNRPDGSGASGFYVYGANSIMPLTMQGHPVSNFGYMKVANRNGPAFNTTGNGTYHINFDTPGKGLNALRFSTEPTGSSITYTPNQSGRFYLTYDSGNGFDDVLLLVGVNGTVGSDFGMHLTAGLYNDSL